MSLGRHTLMLGRQWIQYNDLKKEPLTVENGLCLKYGPAFQPGGHVDNAEPEMLEFQEGWPLILVR